MYVLISDLQLSSNRMAGSVLGLRQVPRVQSRSHSSPEYEVERTFLTPVLIFLR
jgi:hypothetical protein